MTHKKDNNLAASSLLYTDSAENGDEYEDSFVGKCLDNRYDIIGIIASGGMGDVYLARQRGVGLDVAVKKLHDAYYRNPKVVERFIDEARLYARITHPNAVKLHDLLSVKGQICIVMEYVHGRTLTSYTDSGFVFNIRQILDIGLQLADALGTVHNAGVIHRDLKSQNVMLLETVNNRFSVKILDFGIAKMMDKPNVTNTEDGFVVGSPQFMSPEQCYGNEIDERADIYAFGILLYSMICNRLPFNADTPMELMQMQTTAPVPAMHRPDGSEIPPGLDALVRKCLEKKASDRYASFAEVITDLTCLQEGKQTCIAESHDVHVADVMAAIAAAEKELSCAPLDDRRQFSLDAGETRMTKSPYITKYKIGRLLIGFRASNDRRHNSLSLSNHQKLHITKFLIVAALGILGITFAILLALSFSELSIHSSMVQNSDDDASNRKSEFSERAQPADASETVIRSDAGEPVSDESAVGVMAAKDEQVIDSDDKAAETGDVLNGEHQRTIDFEAENAAGSIILNEDGEQTIDFDVDNAEAGVVLAEAGSEHVAVGDLENADETQNLPEILEEDLSDWKTKDVSAVVRMRELFEARVVDAVRQLNYDGNLESAKKWIEQYDERNDWFILNNEFDDLRLQNQKFEEMLGLAREYQQNNQCSKIDILLQALPSEAEGMAQELKELKTCQPKKNTKSKKKSKHKNNTKRKSKRNTGFDWSSIKTK